jgi:hypothetical protein
MPWTRSNRSRHPCGETYTVGQARNPHVGRIAIQIPAGGLVISQGRASRVRLRRLLNDLLCGQLGLTDH